LDKAENVVRYIETGGKSAFGFRLIVFLRYGSTADWTLLIVSTSFTYNDHGSMTRKTVAGVVSNFVYTVDNRLERVEDVDNTAIASYYYGPFGRRLWKDVAGGRIYCPMSLVKTMDFSPRLLVNSHL